MTVNNIRQNEIYNENLSFIRDLVNGSPQLLDLSVFPFELGQMLIQLPSPKLKLVAKDLASAPDLYKDPKQLQQLLSELELENTESFVKGSNIYQSRLESKTEIIEVAQDSDELPNQLNNITFFYRSLGYALYSQLIHEIDLESACKNFGIISFKIGLLSYINTKFGKKMGDYYVKKIFELAIEWANLNQMTLVHRFGVKGSILIVDKSQKGLTKEGNQKLEKSFVDYVSSKIKQIMSEKLQGNDFRFEPLIVTGTASIHTSICNLKISKTSTRNKTYFEISKVIGDACHFLCDARLEKELKRLGEIWLKKDSTLATFLVQDLESGLGNDELPEFLGQDRLNNVTFLNYLYQQSIFLNFQITNSQNNEIITYFKQRKVLGFIRAGLILQNLTRLRN